MARLLPFKLRRYRTVLLLVALFVLGNVLLYAKFKYTVPEDRHVSSTLGIRGGEERIKKQEYNLVTTDQSTANVLPGDVTVGLQTTHEKIPVETNREQKYQFKIAVVVIACNRPSVGRCLDRLMKFKPKHINVPIIVSQDCGDKPTESVIRAYGDAVELIQQPIIGDVDNVPPNMQRFMGYYKISRHYRFALDTVFQSHPELDSVVIVEDDIDIASDFYEYFLATRPLMEMDKSIWCVSAWNDNGKKGFVEGNDVLYRSDFFPGLGWMITRDVWQELAPKWPLGFWDDWMRNPLQRKGRACIRPEISRTKTFGRVGVSLGQFFDQHLTFIKLNDVHYHFLSKDLSYLVKERYDKEFLAQVNNAPIVNSDDLRIGNINSKSVRIMYQSKEEFEFLARLHGLMTDLKAGVPRGAYLGIVSFVKNGVRVYLTPPSTWTGYQE